MKQRCVMLGVLLAVLAGCGSRRPEGIIPFEEMGKVMTDLIYAEEYAANRAARDSAFDVQKETVKLYAQVLEIHGTTRQNFMQSFDYYLARPEKTRNLFDSLATRLRRNLVQSAQPPAFQVPSAPTQSGPQSQSTPSVPWRLAKPQRETQPGQPPAQTQYQMQ